MSTADHSQGIVTAAQLAERDDYESLMMRGVVSLADGLMLMLSTGAPATPYLLARLENAFQAYQYGGKDADLAREFGVLVTQRERQSEDRRTLVNHVRFHIDALHEQGHGKLGNPAQERDTVFEVAATGVLMDFTAGNLYHMYYKG